MQLFFVAEKIFSLSPSTRRPLGQERVCAFYNVGRSDRIMCLDVHIKEMNHKNHAWFQNSSIFWNPKSTVIFQPEGKWVDGELGVEFAGCFHVLCWSGRNHSAWSSTSTWSSSSFLFPIFTCASEVDPCSSWLGSVGVPGHNQLEPLHLRDLFFVLF